MQKEKPRSKNMEFEIELHFQDKDEIPESKRIDPEVRIVSLKERGEFLIERDLDDKKQAVINAGGLALKVNFNDFIDQFAGMLKHDFNESADR